MSSEKVPKHICSNDFQDDKSDDDKSHYAHDNAEAGVDVSDPYNASHYTSEERDANDSGADVSNHSFLLLNKTVQNLPNPDTVLNLPLSSPIALLGLQQRQS